VLDIARGYAIETRVLGAWAGVRQRSGAGRRRTRARSTRSCSR
jgi:hypothetical protein